MPVNGPLLTALLREQRRQHLSDPQMIERLGISERSWYFLKAGTRQPGRKLLKAIVRTFPSLQHYVLEELSTGVDDAESA